MCGWIGFSGRKSPSWIVRSKQRPQHRKACTLVSCSSYNKRQLRYYSSTTICIRRWYLSCICGTSCKRWHDINGPHHDVAYRGSAHHELLSFFGIKPSVLLSCFVVAAENSDFADRLYLSSSFLCLLIASPSTPPITRRNPTHHGIRGYRDSRAEEPN